MPKVFLLSKLFDRKHYLLHMLIMTLFSLNFMALCSQDVFLLTLTSYILQIISHHNNDLNFSNLIKKIPTFFPASAQHVLTFRTPSNICMIDECEISNYLCFKLLWVFVCHLKLSLKFEIELALIDIVYLSGSNVTSYYQNISNFKEFIFCISQTSKDE